MKFIANDNISKSVIKKLVEKRFDITDIRKFVKSATDEELLEIANKENRVILTHDKDFGNLIRQKNISHKGIIIIKCKSQDTDKIINLINKAISSDLIKDIKNSIILISETHMTIYRISESL